MTFETYTNPDDKIITMIPLKDAAIALRQALKDAFPGLPPKFFAVHTKKNGGYYSIKITWTDGPTTKDVDTIGQRFTTSTHGLVPTPKYSLVDGNLVRYNVDAVCTDRIISVDLFRQAAQAVADRYGCKVATVADSGTGAFIDPEYDTIVNGEQLHKLVAQEAYATSCYPPVSPQPSPEPPTPPSLTLVSSSHETPQALLSVVAPQETQGRIIDIASAISVQYVHKWTWIYLSTQSDPDERSHLALALEQSLGARYSVVSDAWYVKSYAAPHRILEAVNVA